MSLAWGSRLSGSSLAWGARTASATEGIINGSAQVSSFVERDLALSWQLNGGVESDLSLLWQLNANPITGVESDLQLTWNVITEAGTYVEADLSLLWQRGGSVQGNLYLNWNVIPVMDSAGVSVVRRAVKHPGWSRKQAEDVLARERAMERSIREVLNPEAPIPAALKVQKPPQKTAAQMAAEMASAQAARVARQRAVELGMEAQRARIEIERLQPELMQRRQQVSYRVIEQLLRGL